MQVGALLMDSLRLLRSRKLFWISLILSLIVVVIFIAIGFDKNGIVLFWYWDFDIPALSTDHPLQLWKQFELIAALPAFQGALASAAAVQLLQQHLFANHDRGQPGTGGQPQIKVGEVAVVSHQGRPLHGNALGAIRRCCLELFQRDGHRAGFWPSGSAEKQALVGFQQIEPNRSQVEAAQPTQQGASAQLQGH